MTPREAVLKAAEIVRAHIANDKRESELLDSILSELRAEAATLEEPSSEARAVAEKRRMQGCCIDCGRKYGDEHGFPDLVVPEDAWKRLSPTGDEGGLLCPSCLCRRAHDAGVRCEARFTSGPFCSPDTPQPASAQEKVPEESAWLIEKDDGSPFVYWLGRTLEQKTEWTHNASEAIRFARKEDAEAMIALRGDSPPIKATEHIWSRPTSD